MKCTHKFKSQWEIKNIPVGVFLFLITRTLKSGNSFKRCVKHQTWDTWASVLNITGARCLQIEIPATDGAFLCGVFLSSVSISSGSNQIALIMVNGIVNQKIYFLQNVSIIAAAMITAKVAFVTFFESSFIRDNARIFTSHEWDKVIEIGFHTVDYFKY